LRALTIGEAALGRDHPRVADALEELAGLYEAQGAYRQARPIYERALAIREATSGENDPRNAEALNHLLMGAGAETVVMSLWKVNDETTRTLMEAYYTNLLAGQGRAFALHQAMRWLRTSQPHPHDWAPFITLGRDAPLRNLLPAAQQASQPVALEH
jgi:tetratricopeptide (TPR) repeat protein